MWILTSSRCTFKYLISKCKCIILALPLFFCHTIHVKSMLIADKRVNEYGITLKGKNIEVGRERDTFLSKVSYVPSILSGALYGTF